MRSYNPLASYWIPTSDSKGNKYHIINHGKDNLIPATEEEIIQELRNGNLEGACKHCIQQHNLIPIEYDLRL